MIRSRFKYFMPERNEFSTNGEETLLSVSEYYGVKPRAEVFESDAAESRAESLEGYRRVHPGDFVMNYMLAWKGAYGVSEHDGIVSPAYAVYRIDPRYADRRYIHHRLRSEHMRSAFKARSKGIIESRLRLYPDTFLSMEIELPDLETQKAIADFLDRETARIDQLIEKKQRLVELVREQTEAVIANSLSRSGHDDVELDPKDWRVPAPEGWIVRPLRAVCSIYGRIGFRGYTTEDIVDEGEGAITLSPSNILSGELDLSDRTYLSWEKYEESPEIQVSDDDIIFVKTGSTIGKVALITTLEEPMTLNPQLVVLKNHKIDSVFLWLSMLTKPFQYQVSWNRFGGSTPAMSQGHLGRLRLAFPESLQRQKNIAGRIVEKRQKAAYLERTISASIDGLRELRAALITAAVTGQIDVTTWRKKGQTDRRLDQIEEAMRA